MSISSEAGGPGNAADARPTDLRLSVIITALNEEKNLAAAVRGVLDAFDHFGIAAEAIVIDDGSSDGTGDLARRLAQEDARVRLLFHVVPQGVGASFWEGVDVAQGDAVMWFPGDNENDAREILRYHRLLEQVDIVVPFTYNQPARPPLRNALSLAYRLIVKATFLVDFHYTNGTVMYRRSLLKGLASRSTGFFFQTDLLIRIAKEGYLFAEVPYRLGRRSAGSSKAVTLASFLRLSKDYLRLVWDIHFRRQTDLATPYPDDSLTKARR